MQTINIGVYEAKTQLSKLIERANSGYQVTITQRGQPVAQLTPYQDKNEAQNRRRLAIKGIRNFQAQQKPVKTGTFEQLLKADQR